ncbi:hypothetical protein [Nitrosarchaeum sp. AC2]|uniref:hypothetical protein n=1 Tax=Nitrosarchaeum sp. AC2 TaxID=2259673 RepID=UPI0015C96519|nr:hypothetical protein [Nitrosarchaeum sp. AC2]QLH11230.1 hypothetical protein DSQ20_06995 [Nitrosarchaeum sp. AC2]
MSKDEGRILMGERWFVAPKKELGGTEMFQTEGGNFNNRYQVFCDVCGIKVDPDKITICQEQQHKTCSECFVRFEQKNICVDCLKEKVPLSKQQFKILVSVFSGICWTHGLHSVTHMPKFAIERTISELAELGYVQKKRILWMEITDVGLDVLTAYRTVYPRDRDVANLNWELRRRE